MWRIVHLLELDRVGGKRLNGLHCRSESSTATGASGTTTAQLLLYSTRLQQFSDPLCPKRQSLGVGLRFCRPYVKGNEDRNGEQSSEPH